MQIQKQNHVWIQFINIIIRFINIIINIIQFINIIN